MERKLQLSCPVPWHEVFQGEQDWESEQSCGLFMHHKGTGGWPDKALGDKESSVMASPKQYITPPSLGSAHTPWDPHTFYYKFTSTASAFQPSICTCTELSTRQLFFLTSQWALTYAARRDQEGGPVMCCKLEGVVGGIAWRHDAVTGSYRLYERHYSNALYLGECARETQLLPASSPSSTDLGHTLPTLFFKHAF